MTTFIQITCKGPRKRRELRVVLVSGGITVESCHPTLEASELPLRPVVEGADVLIPAKTLENLIVIAGCASNDSTRYVLNGVLFTPEEGGRLVATDGKRLGCTPAVVPPVAFILPNTAVHVLVHPDFTAGDATMRLQTEAENPWVSIRSGRHHLMTRIIEGTYPGYRQVIPWETPHLVTFSTEHRTTVIKWLRGLFDHDPAVNLSWERKGHLTLAQRTSSGISAVMRAPVEIEGTPPLIAFDPGYLADALEIGSTLCLSDELSPGVCRHPSGRFCVLMPKRVTIATSEFVKAEAEAEKAA